MGITIITAGAWGTLASLFFFLAALLGGDLLALRGCLLLAYIFLLINGATGLPGWLSAVVHGQISVSASSCCTSSHCLGPVPTAVGDSSCLGNAGHDHR